MRDTVILVFALILNVLLVRLYIDTVIEYKLNKNAIKKRKENRTIVKWVFYTQYRDVIPPIMLFWYFAEITLVFLFGIISCVFQLLETNSEISNKINFIFLFIAIAPKLFLSIFWGWHYGIPNKEQAAKLVDLKKRYHKKRKSIHYKRKNKKTNHNSPLLSAIKK